jgi:hypothetical protein
MQYNCLELCLAGWTRDAGRALSCLTTPLEAVRHFVDYFSRAGFRGHAHAPLAASSDWPEAVGRV